MTTENLSSFLKALDVVKQDHTCGLCSELCKNPVTLSKCFHLICADHFKDLKYCPVCKISLDGCSTFSDDRLNKSVEAVAELGKIFDKFKPEDLRLTRSASVEEKPKSKSKPYKAPSSSSKKVGKNVLSDKTNQLKPDLESSLVSSISIKTAEKRNNKGETMLHIACRLGKLDKVTELLNQGANTNTKDNAGWTPLHEAVQNGRLDLVSLLLQYNTLINVPGQGNETPLHEAVRFNHIDIARELVRNGADINMRNCKGETPLQLAVGEMKETLLSASEDIVHTQTVNVTHMSALYSELDSEDIRIYCVSEYRTVHNKLKLLVKHHSNLHIEAKFTKKVTHLLVDTEDDGVCPSSLDILQGIVMNIWILSSQWITKSTDSKLEPFGNYEITGIGSKSYNGPKNSRYNKYKQLPGLFNGCHIYFHNFNTKYEISKSIVVNKAILTKLVTDAGGIVLRRVPNPESIPESEKLVPYHAKRDGKLTDCSHYIIFKDVYEPMYNMKHLKALPVGWLIECLEKYELCEPIDYNYL
ncbi:BRCA1-associated RING domain protein 1-like [Galleria mellonella]|uniref:BRCA1-associated RING domain protein 1-like n=1 Tax=Galleria mellonella TaxID=7137 RepID=A0A6J1W8K7_GALME|nr:BRCA1-associated RING domain protein 1-like [Galleria mellonella]